MRVADIFLENGEERLRQLLRTVSMGKLRTYQMFEPLKIRLHLSKLNSENLRKASPRFLERIRSGDEALATDLAQAILISHMDMIQGVLDFLGIPNENGFFAKDLDPAPYLTEGWQQRVWDEFRGKAAPEALEFYINHLGIELGNADRLFQPGGDPAPAVHAVPEHQP